MACHGVEDTTISFNHNTEFRNLYIGLTNQLEKNTDFTALEITCLLKIFYKFFKSFKSRSTDIRKLTTWFGIFGIVDEFIVTQILRYLKYDVTKSYIDPRLWIHLMDIFFSNNIKKQIKYAFQIYDAEENGYLTTKDVAHRVHDYFKTDDEDENDDMRLDMMDLLFQKFDLDLDGIISFEEYQNVVMEQPLLLECFGRCLPAPHKRKRLVLMQNLLEKLSRSVQILPQVIEDVSTNKSKRRDDSIIIMKYKTRTSHDLDTTQFKQSRMHLFGVAPSRIGYKEISLMHKKINK